MQRSPWLSEWQGLVVALSPQDGVGVVVWWAATAPGSQTGRDVGMGWRPWGPGGGADRQPDEASLISGRSVLDRADTCLTWATKINSPPLSPRPGLLEERPHHTADNVYCWSSAQPPRGPLAPSSGTEYRGSSCKAHPGDWPTHVGPVGQRCWRVSSSTSGRDPAGPWVSCSHVTGCWGIHPEGFPHDECQKGRLCLACRRLNLPVVRKTAE